TAARTADAATARPEGGGCGSVDLRAASAGGVRSAPIRAVSDRVVGIADDRVLLLPDDPRRPGPDLHPDAAAELRLQRPGQRRGDRALSPGVRPGRQHFLSVPAAHEEVDLRPGLRSVAAGLSDAGPGRGAPVA